MTTSNPAVAEQAHRQLIAGLKVKPLIAWPTVLLLAACHVTIFSVWYFVLTDQMSLAVGCVLNIIAYYFLFTPAHDSMHKAVSRIDWVNDLVLFLVYVPVVPGVDGKLARLMHMQHHRFANDALDPDHDLAKDWKNAFFLWFFWDFRYSWFYAKHQDKYPAYEEWRRWKDLGLFAVFAGLMLYYVPVEMFFLWFIPTRMMVWLICAVFMYLPHYPHDIKDKDQPYKATLMREGWDWLLTPLMTYQNYHLVHHLYPTVPFYRYKKVWDAAKDYHEAQKPAVVKAFKLMPER